MKSNADTFVSTVAAAVSATVSNVTKISSSATRFARFRILGEEIDVTVGRVQQEYAANRLAAIRGEEYEYILPLIPGCYRKGGHDSRELVYSDEAGSLISRERLWRGAALISRTYCILTAYGMGIAGRVHAPGLHIPRYIMLEAYSKEGSASHQVWVTMEVRVCDKRKKGLASFSGNSLTPL